MRRFKMIFILVLINLLVATSLQVQAAPVKGVYADTPAYAGQGPYEVGRTWFKIGKETKSPFVVVAWYPALKPVGDKLVGTLTVPDEYQTPNPEEIIDLHNLGTSVLNATPDNSKAPYPLVIFSPGFGDLPFRYTRLEEHLASYGFVVISALLPEHVIWSHYITRPTITIREIDFAEQLTIQDGSFKGLIDAQHIGAVGHSSGGYTALAAGGAQLDFAWFETWCGEHNSPDAMLVCPDLLGHKKDMLALAKLDTMPAGLWPSWGDPRVSAIVSQSGDAYVFGPMGLASITIPVMVQVGSNDNANIPEWSAYLTYENVSSTQKSEVVFEGGEHYMFGDWGGVWTTDTTHNLINHFTTAFLLDTLKDDNEAHKALLPDAVNFTDITYQTTMK